MPMFNFDFSFVRAGAPIITLSTTGLAFNPVVRSMLNYPEEIDIGYDEAENVIGICAHREENGGKPYIFESRQKDGWVRISCRDFMRYLSMRSGIDFVKAKQFIPEYDEKQKMLVVVVDDNHMKQARSNETE